MIFSYTMILTLYPQKKTRVFCVTTRQNKSLSSHFPLFFILYYITSFHVSYLSLPPHVLLVQMTSYFRCVIKQLLNYIMKTLRVNALLLLYCFKKSRDINTITIFSVSFEKSRVNFSPVSEQLNFGIGC